MDFAKYFGPDITATKNWRLVNIVIEQNITTLNSPSGPNHGRCDGHGDCHYHYQSHSHGQGLSLNVSGILYSTFKMTLADSLTKDW